MIVLHIFEVSNQSSVCLLIIGVKVRIATIGTFIETIFVVVISRIILRLILGGCLLLSTSADGDVCTWAENAVSTVSFLCSSPLLRLIFVLYLYYELELIKVESIWVFWSSRPIGRRRRVLLLVLEVLRLVNLEIVTDNVA